MRRRRLITGSPSTASSRASRGARWRQLRAFRGRHCAKSTGPSPRVRGSRALGLAACDRPYRAGARAHGGRLSGPVGPGVVIRRAMQRTELALRRHPRYPGVRFLGRCHCYCSLTLVQSAGRGSVRSAMNLAHYPSLRSVPAGFFRRAWRSSGLRRWFVGSAAVEPRHQHHYDCESSGHSFSP